MFLIIGLVIFVPLLVLYLYTRLTCGLCKCSKHLVGKVVIVTGANSGIGYESAKNFAERGAKVILACRNEQRGIEARDKIVRETGNQDVHFEQLDLASFSSVRKFAGNINKNEERLDILVNNAGIIMSSKKVLSEDGLLLGMHTNHYGPFLLTSLLLDKITASAPSRIINVSSGAHRSGKIEFDNLNMEKESSTVKPFAVYSNSKLCNVLMTVELARRLKGTGVTTNALCPGMVQTEIINSFEGWVMAILFFFAKYFIMKTSWEGAQTMIYLAVSPDVNNISGKYFQDCSLAKNSNLSKDADLAQKLWEHSENVCKVKCCCLKIFISHKNYKFTY